MIVERWTGQEAADLRAALRMPITAFAAYLGISERQVSTWDKQLRAIGVSPLLASCLDTALSAASAAAQDRFLLLSLRHQPPTDLDEDAVASDLSRRELLRLLSLAAPAVAFSGAATAPREDLEHALAGYNDGVSRLWRIYSEAVPKAAVLPLVNAELGIITARLRASSSSRQQLCALASELFQLAGEILFDQDRYGDAAHCYTVAATAAQEAGSNDLWACAMTRHSFLYVYGETYEPALPLLEYAADIAGRGDPDLPVRQWVSAVKAQVHSGLGQLGATERALDVAQDIRSRPPGGWLRFDGSRLAEERGACYARLGRPDFAAASLEAALQLGDLSGRRQGSIHTDLAKVGIQRHDLDEFWIHAGAALDLAELTKSGYVARQLRALRVHLEPMPSTPQIRETCERIAALRTENAA